MSRGLAIGAKCTNADCKAADCRVLVNLGITLLPMIIVHAKSGNLQHCKLQ